MSPQAEKAFAVLAAALAKIAAKPDAYDPHDPTGWREEAEIVRDLGTKFQDAMQAYVTNKGTAHVFASEIENAVDRAAYDLEDAAADFTHEHRHNPPRWSGRLEKYV